MILSALSDYYQSLLEEQLKGPPAYRRAVAGWGYMEKGVSWAVVIDGRGAFKGLEDLREEQKKTVKNQSQTKVRPRRMMVPFTLSAAGRTSGKEPFPLWDKPAYALGWEDDKKCPDHFRLFKALAQKLSRSLPEEKGLSALTTFLEQEPDPSSWPQWSEVAAGDNLVFRLVEDRPGVFLHDRSVFNAYWAAHWLEYSREPGWENFTGQCLLCGETRPIARLHQPTQGVRGAQTSGARLVSFNIDAFESYGLKSGANAPISEEGAFAYTTALKYLLRSENRRSLQLADSTVIFWAERPGPEEYMIWRLLNPGTPDENKDAEEGEEAPDGAAADLTAEKVRSFLLALREGHDVKQAGDFDFDQKFYILSLAPNMARLSVRLWLKSSFGELAERVQRHVHDIHIVKQYENEPDFLDAWRLLAALAPSRRDKNGSFKRGSAADAPPNVAGALTRAILLGEPYPLSAYQTLLGRFRADGDISYPRAALLKGALKRKYNLEVSPMLDTDRFEPAYLSGRLFAVLEKAQEEALEGLNATIKDRFFGAAGATPATVFPQLLRLSVHHLAKLDTGRKIFLEKLTGEIIDKLPAFPKRLKLEEQGLFVIGYYQQRADFFKKRETPATGQDKGE